MLETSMFFNASIESIATGNPDKVYYAADVAKYFSILIGNGVFLNPANQLKVEAGDALTIIVKPGSAWIDGYAYVLEGEKEITLELNTTEQTKHYYVCCTLKLSERKIETVVREIGTVNYPVNDGNTHELILAQIELPTAASVISNSMITDKRPYTEYCGFASMLPGAINMDDLFLQFQNAFDIWFNSVKGVLTDDAAGNLLALIQELDTKVESLDIPIIEDSGSVGSGLVWSSLFLKNILKNKLSVKLTETLIDYLLPANRTIEASKSQMVTLSNFVPGGTISYVICMGSNNVLYQPFWNSLEVYISGESQMNYVLILIVKNTGTSPVTIKGFRFGIIKYSIGLNI